jgi:uncharacterized membrane protein YedE/YeeE
MGGAQRQRRTGAAGLSLAVEGLAALDALAESLKRCLTLLTALLGGLLIGASASLAWSGARQIAGISGIVGGLLRAPFVGSFRRWFLIGLLLTSLGLGVLGGAPAAAMSVAPRPLAWLLVAGLLVGFGTQLGSGCTSGHGVCGLSRLSLRSLVATLTFIATASLVVLITRHAFARAIP